jgi:hypothetical protein
MGFAWFRIGFVQTRLVWVGVCCRQVAGKLVWPVGSPCSCSRVCALGCLFRCRGRLVGNVLGCC